MRWGIYLNPQTPGPDHDGRIIREVMSQVDLCEMLGAEYCWLTDHQFTGYNAFSEPVTMAAAISQRNRKLRLSFAVAVLPLRHPLQFVTQCNLLDQLTNGNFVVGMGVGNSPDEYRGYGLDTEERHERMTEFLAVADQAWNAPAGGFHYSGKHYNGKMDGRVIPAPVQKPRPHVAFATSTPATLERIGRQGWSLLVGPQNPTIIGGRLHYYYRGLDTLDEAAQQRALYDTGVLRQIYVAAPGEDWQDTIGTNMENYLRQSAKANTGIDDLSKTDLEARKQGYMNSWLFAGTADEIVEKLRPFGEMGIEHIMCWITFGYMPDHLARQTILRFASDVAPRLAEIKPDPEKIQKIRTEAAAPTRPSDYAEERAKAALANKR